ncbi:X-ray repair cross-complementing protein 5-like [Chironomus tepperi]|uniref:X-ray repair cross-complementing protein 5-like n=1 Tax=Chironomus tepperi TaxID=113505 RepID=UPI00391F089C
MSRVDKEAVVICLDVGKNASEMSEKSGKTFLQRSLDCVKKIITRKIFAKPYDEIGIILFGTDDTKNDLNDKNFGYDNIVEMDTLKMPSWTMLEEVCKIKPGNALVGWSDGLLVAMNYMSTETEAKKFSHLRIILFSNFMTSTNDQDLDVITSNISNLEIELIGVSDTVCHETDAPSWQFSQNPQKKDSQRESEQIFQKMIKEIEGANLCHIDYVESELVYFQKKTNRGNPWNVPLKIGNELSMNVSAYVYVQKSSLVSFKTECTEFNTVTKMVTEYTKNNEKIEKPTEDDIVKAFHYGSKLNACDDSGIAYDSGDKCLLTLAFCKRKRCASNLFAGTGCHIIVPQKDCPKSAKLFSALVRNLLQKDYFLLARKVYRKGTKPLVVGLFPQKKDDGLCLVMIEMPFEDNIQRCRFEKLRLKKSTKPSDEQMEAMEKLVNAMDLTNAIDDESGITEAFTVETSLNPFQQHICRTISRRALNPNAPLPTFDNELKKMIDVPEKIANEAADIIKEIENLFPLEIIHRKEKKVFGQKEVDDIDDNLEDEEILDVTQAESNERLIVAVGTVTPAEDFLYLINKKTERFGVVCDQIQSVIHELLFKSTVDHGDKIKEALVAYRDVAKIHGPFNYNTWIKELKKLMVRRNKIDEWYKYIVTEGVGLITINESPVSTVTMEENLEFYEIISKETSNVTSNINPEDDELENLL